MAKEMVITIVLDSLEHCFFLRCYDGDFFGICKQSRAHWKFKLWDSANGGCHCTRWATKTSCKWGEVITPVIKWDYNPQFPIIFKAIYRVYFIPFLYRSVFWGPPCMVLMNWSSWLVKQLARLSLKPTAKSPPENGPLKTPQKEARNIFQWSIFRGKLAVSFRECIPRKILKTIFVICLMALSSV